MYPLSNELSLLCSILVGRRAGAQEHSWRRALSSVWCDDGPACRHRGGVVWITVDHGGWAGVARRMWTGRGREGTATVSERNGRETRAGLDRRLVLVPIRLPGRSSHRIPSHPMIPILTSTDRIPSPARTTPARPPAAAILPASLRELRERRGRSTPAPAPAPATPPSPSPHRHLLHHHHRNAAVDEHPLLLHPLLHCSRPHRHSSVCRLTLGACAFAANNPAALCACLCSTHHLLACCHLFATPALLTPTPHPHPRHHHLSSPPSSSRLYIPSNTRSFRLRGRTETRCWFPYRLLRPRSRARHDDSSQQHTTATLNC